MLLVIIVASLAMIFARPATAQPVTVRVLASNGVKGVLEKLHTECERAIGQELSFEFDSTAGLRRRIDAGERFDVVILTSEAIDDLAKSGRIAAATRTGLARCGIGIGNRAGEPRPDIHSPDALRQTLLRVKSITYAQDGASRPHLEKIFDEFGIANALRPKITMQQGSTRSTAMVARGDAELVLTLISEIVPAPGIQLVGPLPAELQSYIRFAAAAAANPQPSGSAQALIRFLAGSSAARAYQAGGMEPFR